MRNIVTITRVAGDRFIVMYDDGSTIEFYMQTVSLVTHNMTKTEFVEFYHYVMNCVDMGELPIALGQWVRDTRDLLVNGGPGIYRVPSMTDEDFTVQEVTDASAD